MKYDIGKLATAKNKNIKSEENQSDSKILQIMHT